MKENNTGLLGSLLGTDTKVTVDVVIDNASITRLCVGLLIVTTISLLIFGIIKKSI